MTNPCIPSRTQAFTSTEVETENEAQLAAQAKALAHPARIRVLKILVNLDNTGGCLNSDLVSDLGLAQSTVSEHLRILKAAEFITAEPNPPKVCYRVNRAKLNQFSALFASIFQ
ncbi:winged helix-turn-helix domain-containing protein [Vibrio profundum]|uniref:ArsR/SmtB family transcription factor n=1 Tax=Vibrio profundum TaxID=2910247 RepID=UPI003D0EEF3C